MIDGGLVFWEEDGVRTVSEGGRIRRERGGIVVECVEGVRGVERVRREEAEEEGQGKEGDEEEGGDKVEEEHKLREKE